MLSKVISGGETGVDQAALEAAKACGIATGGTIGKGFMTESGSDPSLGEKYGLVELTGRYSTTTTANQHVVRSKLNVDNSDGTLILGFGWDGTLGGPGTRKTLGYCITGKWQECADWKTKIGGVVHKKVMVLQEPNFLDPDNIAQAANRVGKFVENHAIKTLNIAGPRGSKMGVPYSVTVSFLRGVFGYMQEKMAEPKPALDEINRRLEECKAAIDTRIGDCEDDHDFECLVITGFNKVLEDLNKLTEDNPRLRGRRQQDFNSYTCIVQGMEYQVNRSEKRLRELQDAHSKVTRALLNAGGNKSPEELCKLLSDIQKEDTQAEYLQIFNRSENPHYVVRSAPKSAGKRPRK